HREQASVLLPDASQYCGLSFDLRSYDSLPEPLLAGSGGRNLLPKYLLMQGMARNRQKESARHVSLIAQYNDHILLPARYQYSLRAGYGPIIVRKLQSDLTFA